MLPLLCIDAFALAVLLLIFLNIRQGAGHGFFDQDIFLLLVITGTVILALDMVMWTMEGRPGLRAPYQAVSALYYTLNPLICAEWYFYVDFRIYGSRARLKRLALPMAAPVAILAALAAASVWTGWMFSVDSRGVYHRGPLFTLMAIVSLLYLAYGMVLVAVNRARVEKREFWPLLLFPLPTLAGGVAQSLYYGISTVWPCAALSALIIFINTQNTQLYTDPLTGLFNRRHLEKYLRQHEQPGGKGLLGGIMLDLNAFKAINDVYGHDAGDEALRQTARLLKETFRSGDFIVRYGGDEFLIFMTVPDRWALEGAVGRLRETFRRFNERRETPYAIDISVGYDCCGDDISAYNSRLDERMYSDKQGRANGPEA